MIQLQRRKRFELTMPNAAIKYLTLGISGVFLFVASALGQFTSGIEGTVTDPNGRVVPGVSVSIENMQTGITQTTKTTIEGYYRFTTLPAAPFTITASAAGFEVLIQKNIRLNVAATTTVNLALRVGSTSTEVTVSAAPPELQLADASVSGVVGQKDVENLPLVGRNFYDLVVLSPGVTGLPTGGGQAYAQATGDIFAGEYSVNLNAGMRTESNNFLIDSAPVNSNPREGVVNVDPNAESVQELRVAINAYNAEYGGAGAITNVITKQGSNQFHGTLDEFHTDNVLQARSYFEPQVPVNRRNEFGGSAGGPIWKNHTFFFGSLDVLRSGVASGSSQVVFTPDFVKFLQTNYPNKISTYLLTTFPVSVTPTSNFQTAGIMSGINCSSLTSPSATISTLLGPAPCNLPILGAGLWAITSPRNGLQWNARVDHSTRSGSDHIYANFFRTTLTTTTPSVYSAFSVPAPENTFYGNVSEIHIFTPNILNQARYSYTRLYGIDECANCRIPTDIILGTDDVGSTFGPFPFTQNNFEGADVLIWNKGAHSLTFGATLRRMQNDANALGAFQRPDFVFLNALEFAADQAFEEVGLTVNPVTGQGVGAEFNDRRQFINAFVQDNWKAAPNLTFNLGLRWETFGNFEEDTRGETTNIMFQGGNNFASLIANAKVDVVPRVLNKNIDKNFSPRFGWSWDPSRKGRTVIRGGFGVYFDVPSDQMYPLGPENPPLLASPVFSLQTPPYLPVYGLGTSNTPPYGFTVPPSKTGLDSKNGLLGGLASLTVMDPNMKAAYSEKWSLGIQKSIGSGWVAEAGYVGAAGHHQYAEYDVNRFDGDLIKNKGVLTRLNTSFAGISYAQANLNASYNAGTVAVRNRGNHGLNMQVAYTFGKTIDQASSFSSSVVEDITNLGQSRGLADYDVKQKLAISLLYDLPAVRIGSDVVKAFVNGWQIGDVTILQGGPPFSVYCSAAFHAVFNSSGNVVGNSGCDYNADGNDHDSPMAATFGNTIHGVSRSQYIKGLFNCTTSLCGNIFSAPPLGQEGTLGRNTFRSPGYADSDISLMKTTKLLGETSLQFRAEMFNAFNRVNLTGVMGDINNSQIGRSTSSYAPRNLQVGLRLVF